MKPVDQAIAATKSAQIIALIKDNQLLTAAIVFILWQAGAIAHAATVVGGVC
jgi:hypothetical protein